MSTSVASVVSHFPSAENGFTTTTSGSVSSGATTVGLNSVAGYANGEVAVFVIDPSNSKKQTFTGIIDTSGVQVTSVVWTAGSNVTHDTGATVVDYVTATHISMMTKGILKHATQAGDLDATNTANFQQHIDVVDAKSVRDGNDNELLTWSQTASAINEFTVKNASVGTGPQLQATGGDTNIDVRLVPKGTGRVKKGANNIDAWEEIGRTTLGSSGDTISVTSIPARKHLKVEVFAINSGTIDMLMQFNGITTNTYAWRYSANGGADSTGNTTNIMVLTTGEASTQVSNIQILNTAAQEKSFVGQSVGNTAGAGNAPTKWEVTGKWVNTADQISRIDINNSQSGSFDTGSEVIVYGHN